MKRLSSIQQQQGMTLVEILVAVTISVVLMSGIIQLFIGTRETYTTQADFSRVQENAQFALEVLEHHVLMAGNNGTTTTAPFISANTTNNSGANSNISASAANNNASDQMEIATMGDDSCMNYTETSLIRKRFYIADTDGDGIFGLTCLLTNTTTGATNTTTIVDGIDNMQIQYGEDTDGDCVQNIYRNAGSVSNWDRIITVRIAILASSTGDSVSADGKTHVLLDAAPIGPVNDNSLRKIYTKTIMLRNNPCIEID